MQVAEHTDLVKQAVIGGGKTLDFGISNNAEFFHILSSTLYTDQILAVVREVICNAWDAHIAAGITDTPIQISTEDNKFTVRDFGKGIADADIKPIYCIYGASTKTEDGSQTGGFGLGCKAPFAYTEHFQVISCNNGTKTIYTMTKASTETGGKPGVTTIASFPTDETGITVSVNLEEDDVGHFFRKIKTIVRNGGIKATLNNETLPTLDFTGSTDGLYFVKARSSIGNERILLSYGNILYQVPAHEDYQKYLDNLRSFVYRQNSGSGFGLNYTLVIKVPPNSITVTPSRESLSLQEKTITNLTLLLENAATVLQRDFPLRLISLLKETIDLAAVTGNSRILTTSLPFNFSERNSLKEDEYYTIKSLADLAREYLRNNGNSTIQYGPEITSFFYKYQAQTAAKIGLIDTGLASTYIKNLKDKNDYSLWANKRVISKLYNKIRNTDGLFTYDFWIYDENKINYGSRLKHIHSPIKWKQYYTYCQYDLINKIIVFGSSLQLAKKQLEDVTFNLGNVFLFYKAPVGTKKQAEALAKLQGLGFKVIDVIPKKEATVRVKSNKPKVAKLNGHHPFSNLLGFDPSNTDRTTDFKFVFNLASNEKQEQSGYLRGFSKATSKYIVNQLIGNHGAITLRSNTYEKLISAGKSSYEEFLLDTISAVILNSDNIKKRISMDFAQAVKNRSSTSYAIDIAIAINSSKELKDIFKIEDIELTYEEAMAMEIYNQCRHSSVFRKHTDKIEIITKHLNSIPLVPVAKGLVEFIDSKDYKFVIPDRFNKVVTQLSSPEPKERQTAVMYVLSMLNT